MSKHDLLDFVWWEITGRCQLACDHCYASSGPGETHGTMTVSDWCRVITQTRATGAILGQFIGGEPTLHPALPELVRHALATGMEVEIYTNLVRVTPAMWETFRLPGVRLATSYYSDRAEEHRAITKHPSLRSTTKNIARARELGIPLRAGVIGVLFRQRTGQAAAVLERLGVTEIGYDDLREVGRGIRGDGPGVDQLCGNCADRQVAISPTGEVWPCVFSRWLPVGNVHRSSLPAILMGETFTQVVSDLRREFGERLAGSHSKPCRPDPCSPDCSPSCQPQRNCRPAGNCAPNYSCGPCAPKDQNCNPLRNCNPNKCRPTSK
ncbi:radical SAM protein [Spongiactinospora sp. TRM90649]|uniref:radical SAM protein n=1 Tax=Spongiactinospora sp. TRM90649 TaxID=3031114 RepID=UPI0023F6AFF1|nr:radical SAM protein [Spongiactinospora sp. TRM90649]MDF5751282.1 radical SAM protein [Spongiactinospora sp. TRM90649]